MLQFKENITIYVYAQPVDMRKALNGLSAIIVDELSASPQSGNVFVFYNKSRDKVKLMYWDKNGFVLHYKRLERCKFKVKQLPGAAYLEISDKQLNWLLAGLDFLLMNNFSELDYSDYY